MNNQEDTLLLSRYLDGDLNSSEETLVKKRILSERDLAKEYRRLKTVNDLLVQHLNHPVSKVVAPSTAAMLGPVQSNIISLKSRRNSIWQFATAATFVAAIGLLLVRGWNVPNNGQPVLFEQDHLISSALEQTPSSNSEATLLEDGRKVRPILTFLHANGSWCREYELNTKTANWKGVACRSEQSSWITQALGVESSIKPIVDKYRPAGAAEDGEIGNFVRENAADIPISVDQEKALISLGWK